MYIYIYIYIYKQSGADPSLLHVLRHRDEPAEVEEGAHAGVHTRPDRAGDYYSHIEVRMYDALIVPFI